MQLNNVDNNKDYDILTKAPTIKNTVAVVKNRDDERITFEKHGTTSSRKDKWFNTYDFPILQLSRVNQVLTAEEGTGNMDQNHINCLHRNLASFNPVSRDSDCTIRSVIVQLP